VVQDPALVRLAEMDLLIGDASKARRQMRWEPTVDFRELIRRMVHADLERLRSFRRESGASA
jgi:GDPmannose 4,6-dehydratase